jgi:hypothetical protein
LFDVGGGHQFEGVHAFDGIEAFEVEEWIVGSGSERWVFNADAGEAGCFVGEGVLDFFAASGVGLAGEDSDFEEGVGESVGGLRGGKGIEEGEDFLDGCGFLGDSEEFDGSGDGVFGEGGGCVGEEVDLADAVAVLRF